MHVKISPFLLFFLCRETKLEKELSDLKAQLASFEFGKIESDRQNLDILDQLKAENETIKGGEIS